MIKLTRIRGAIATACVLLLSLPVIQLFTVPASAATLQVCRASSLSSDSLSNPVNPREWRCDPKNNNASYVTSNLYIPPRGDYPEVDGFVYLADGSGYSPYATIVDFTENNLYGVLQAWLPTGNEALAAPRCWRLTSWQEGTYSEVQPDECLARLPSAAQH
jgi:hypothetical protein